MPVQRYYEKFPDAPRMSKQQRHQIRNRHKENARAAVKRAIKSGKLVPAERCMECGSRGMVQAHHHRSYAKQYRLDVIWLCPACHGMKGITRSPKNIPVDFSPAVK